MLAPLSWLVGDHHCVAADCHPAVKPVQKHTVRVAMTVPSDPESSVSIATSEPAALDRDRALLDAFRRGEREALGQVYFDHVDAVAKLVRHGFFLASHGLRVPGASQLDIEHELVQEVFVRAFAERARNGYDGLRPYRPYLLRIAKNLMIDRQRARGHAIAVVPDAAELDAADLATATDTEDELHWQRLTAATSDYVAGLDAEMRSVVRLRFEEERSQQEVAEVLHVSRRRVRTLEQRAQVGLRRHLKRLKLRIDSP
ncbi:MAG TPA: sigma-70 family RNA polymerase sigma factor [Kofleriaceae bacterium]|nr:sigma-70 family RNA polymerase sigma factor [Kofleriaceae bacterium]